MRVAIDWRAALVNSEGIGRYARELVPAVLSCDSNLELGLFGSTLAPIRCDVEHALDNSRTHLARWRLPARAWPFLLAASRRGIDGFVGGADLVHHAQLRPLPVHRAVETGMLFDLLYFDGGSGWLDPNVAREMERRARALVPRLARVQVPSTHVAGELTRRLGTPTELIDVVPLGGDHLQRVPPDTSTLPPAPFILTVGRVDPRKNLGLMARVFDRLAAERKGLHWIVAGPAGFGAEQIGDVLRSARFAERIEWHVHARDVELRALIEACDVFAFPSLAEGFGLPPLEAMHGGAPVVCSNATSLPEVCGAGAVLLDPNDEDSWVARIGELLDDRDARAHWSRAGRARAAETTWRTAGAACLASWRRALG